MFPWGRLPGILPVYLDHVLFPTLKDSGFITEIHHITGEGSDAGVVYCEMQARENEAGDMCDRAMRLAVYPGRCSYKSETGGRLKELRDLTNKTVQDYHSAYYRPDNLCVIVTGQVDFKDLCQACQPTVASIMASERIQKLPALERPFSGPVPMPKEQQRVRMEFPAEDETSGGVVEMCWPGPAWTDFRKVVALKVLLAYLCEDSISPLRKALVETVPPLCGKISEGLHDYKQELINITLDSCDVEQLSKRDVTAEVQAVFTATAAEDGSGIDVARIRSVIRQQQRRHLSAVESNPHDLFSGEIIGSFCYAPDFAPGVSDNKGESVRARLDSPAALEALLEWKSKDWAALCKEFLVSSSNPGVTVCGFPSKKCGETIQSEDAARIEAQKTALGEEGCKKAGETVAAAEEENDVDTPEEVSAEFQVPDVGKVKLIAACLHDRVDVSTVTVKGGVVEEVYGQEAAKLKALLGQTPSSELPSLAFQFDHVPGAQFAKCHVMLPLAGLTTRQLELLPLWVDTAFELPLAKSSLGEAISYEAVVQLLTDTVVDQSCSVGVGGGRFRAGRAGNMLHMSLKVERSRYAEASKLLGRLVADAEFSVDRLQVAAKRMLNDIPNHKRNGRGLMRLAVAAFDFSDDCAVGTTSVFRVEQLLKAVAEDRAVLGLVASELATLRSALLGVAGQARVAGDVAALGDIFGPWSSGPWAAKFGGSGGYSNGTSARPLLARELHALDALKPPDGSTVGCLITSSAEESNYWLLERTSFSDPRSPDLPPLLVAIEYITALEGPFWRQIRGKGFAPPNCMVRYSYGLSHDLDNGKLTFRLFKATNPVAAYQAARTIVQKLCSEGPRTRDYGSAKKEGDEGEEDDVGLDPSALEAAQSGVLFGLIEPVDTVPGAMGEAFANTLQRCPPDQLQWLLKAVQNVTEESVQSAMQKHVLPLFDGSCGRTVSMVAPAQKREELEEAVAKLEPPLKVRHLDVDAFVNVLGTASGFAELRRSLRELASCLGFIRFQPHSSGVCAARLWMSFVVVSAACTLRGRIDLVRIGAT
ncbi:unnamed protein product [Symbiodinium necroappetens]|uniref:Peptidase M16 C-terminal domain-containing protein n=1 Tax=Symbiodinium necroappetens TaxID=1628268 RepID=A0A813BJ52_9DINO|nr:unnamed protein product [Symbiodinium necroappetens]